MGVRLNREFARVVAFARPVFLLLFLIFFGIPVATLAAVGGSISGTVKDASSAVVPKATITVTNTDTNVRQTTTSNDSGAYAFPTLPVGRYDLQITAGGFKPYRRTNIQVDVNSAFQVDATLEFGEVQETVTVEESALQPETVSTQLGDVIAATVVASLPLNGRSYTRQVQGIDTGLVPVPSPADLTGNLLDQASSLTGAVGSPCTVAGQCLADELSQKLGYSVTPGEPYYFSGCSSSGPNPCVFPGAVMPSSVWSAPATNLLKYIPACTICTPGNSIFSSSAFNETLRDDKIGERIDANTRNPSTMLRILAMRWTHSIPAFSGDSPPLTCATILSLATPTEFPSTTCCAPTTDGRKAGRFPESPALARASR